jgi:MerR family mercuric resistance operon transcriptional regulator
LSCRDVDKLARHHLADIQRRVRELRRIARELERTIESCVGGKRGQCAILGALRRRSFPSSSNSQT